jgi:hypothetical protein
MRISKSLIRILKIAPKKSIDNINVNFEFFRFLHICSKFLAY